MLAVLNNTCYLIIRITQPYTRCTTHILLNTITFPQLWLAFCRRTFHAHCLYEHHIEQLTALRVTFVCFTVHTQAH